MPRHLKVRECKVSLQRGEVGLFHLLPVFSGVATITGAVLAANKEKGGHFLIAVAIGILAAIVWAWSINFIMRKLVQVIMRAEANVGEKRLELAWMALALLALVWVVIGGKWGFFAVTLVINCCLG